MITTTQLITTQKTKIMATLNFDKIPAQKIAVKEIILNGLGVVGNGFKITFSDLLEQTGLDKENLCMTLNAITQWNTWNMIIVVPSDNID